MYSPFSPLLIYIKSKQYLYQYRYQYFSSSLILRTSTGTVAIDRTSTELLHNTLVLVLLLTLVAGTRTVLREPVAHLCKYEYFRYLYSYNYRNWDMRQKPIQSKQQILDSRCISRREYKYEY
jgi:hypothetical protein